MADKYTANDMLHDLNEIKEFRLWLSRKQGRSEYDKGYDKGAADTCVLVMSFFKNYLAENK